MKVGFLDSLSPQSRIRSLASLRDSLLRRKQPIEAALRESGGRVSGPSGAAAKLGIPGSTLDSKNQVTEDQQESLQNYRSLNRSRFNYLLNDPRKHDFELRKISETRNLVLS